METRDILNYLGEKIGEMTLPTGTAEEIWQQKLATYAVPAPTAVKPDLTPRQVRQALVLNGIALESVTAAIAQLPEPQRSLAEIEWEYSVAFVRTNPLIAQVAAVLGWSTEQLDSMWDFAKTL